MLGIRVKSFTFNKSNFFILSFFLLSYYGLSQTTTIPDPNFEQALIDLGYDSGTINGMVPTANINIIFSLDIQNYNIQNLTGIEGFSALKELFCGGNLLTSINVTQNSNLQILWCNSNQINSLDVTQNSSLVSLRCENNVLTSLDITQNTSLNVLVCENNQITSLDITQNTTLSRFQCGNNLLSDINLSNNPNLTFFTCENNQLTRIELSINNQLINLNCAFNELTELDLSNHNNLTKLDCSNNQLCRLNIKNSNNNNITLADFSSNPDLNCVVVDSPLASHTNWFPITFTSYVSSQTDCSNFVAVDTINSVITNSFYVLPILINGTYFTQSGGNGISLNAGDTISTSQTVFIYNQNICNNNETSFSIIITNGDYFIPKYFTPNNDGYHDYWKVLDFSNSIKNITIFNKYGKLLKSLLPNSEGWNGTFNGKPLASNDYWYIITLNSGVPLKGHFTLKR